MRAVLALVLVKGALATVCRAPTACDETTPDKVIFVGRVLVENDNKNFLPARMAIEERILNVPSALKEIRVHTGAGWSLGTSVAKGQRWVVISGKPPYGPFEVGISGCSPSFLLDGNGHMLDAVKNQLKGGPPRLVGTVGRSEAGYPHTTRLAGVKIVARGDGGSYETTTDIHGAYELRGIPPGKYELSISKSGFVPGAEFFGWFNWRGASGPELVGERIFRGKVEVPAGHCQVKNATMFPNGRISGTVRDLRGKPVRGVDVDGREISPNGDRHGVLFNTARTDANGRYTAGTLPPGRYTVQFTYRDSSGRQVVSERKGSFVVPESGEVTGIDFVLPRPAGMAKPFPRP
ncbi:MAG: carboxypeptidase-like regulatory domain-containing protein [Bryobacteraceae bacterium]